MFHLILADLSCPSLANYGLGILPIHVETGGFTRKPLEGRLRNICNSGEVENEVHFFLNCNKYNIRTDLPRNVL